MRLRDRRIAFNRSLKLSFFFPSWKLILYQKKKSLLYFFYFFFFLLQLSSTLIFFHFYIGAAIRNGRLDELSNDEAPVLTAPRCRLSYFVKNPGESDVGRPSLDWIIDVPVYTDLRRNQLISAIPVPCNREHRDTWLRRGVALHLTA